MIARNLRCCLHVAIALLCAPLALAAATVTDEPWGKTPSGDAVSLYTITAPHAEVKLSTYGARIVSIRVPNAQGAMGDVVLGFDSVDGYLTGRTSVMGATVGRFANRIAGGQFTLDGATYQIPKNNGNNALHGGTIGFDRKVWSAKKVADGVEMTLVSPDGDMGFPGNLTVHVVFTLKERHGSPALSIHYTATTDKATVVNFTNHSYFNLANDSQSPVLDVKATFQADAFTPADPGGIPTGEIKPVDGTPVDFRQTHTIGERIPPRGYDNNMVLRSPGINHVAAFIEDPSSGRTLQVFTTEPAIEFYSPLFSGPPPAAAQAPPAASAPPSGATPPAADAPRRPAPMAAFCLETQHFPDSPNHANFPSTVLRPGKKFGSTTIYVFGVSAKDAGN